MRLIASIPLSPAPDGTCVLTVPETREGGIRILIRFDGKGYPFEEHFMYARRRSESGPRTFANTEFSPVPPGLRVGPWPGWRGIPPFPEARLRGWGAEFPVLMTPWGDELVTGILRGVATIGPSPGGSMTCTCADRRLVPVGAELYACTVTESRPLPVSLREELTGAHPRLLLTGREIPLLRERAGGSHRVHWKRITGLLESPPLPWEVTAESKVPPGPERLREDDRAMLAAFAALIEPTPARRESARKAIEAYAAETQAPGYEPLTIDTQAGETLFVLCACLDWTHGLWRDDERERLRRWTWEAADICWSHLGYGRRDYAQAHYIGCGLGLLAFSLLFQESHPRAREWTAHLRGVLDQVTAMLPPDGFYPHGINLWIYEYGFLLRWLELFRVACGVDLWMNGDHWRNASAFRGAAASPGMRYGAAFGDAQHLVGGDAWCHDLIAARTGSGDARRLAGALRDIPPEGIDFRSVPPRRRVYEFLYDDAGPTTGPPEEPVSLFRDGGQVFARGNDTLFTFRAGPPLGVQRYAAGEPGGYGHADPSNGSFLLCNATGPVVWGPGPVYRRDTSLHNTITIDGRGQIGDSAVWLPDFLPPGALCPLPRVAADGGRVFISAPLAPSYLPHLGILECTRHICVAPGRWIAGADTVRPAEPRLIQWNIHAPLVRVTGRPGAAIRAELGNAASRCRLTMFDAAEAVAETGIAEFVPAYPHDGRSIAFLRVSRRGEAIRFAWCILIDEAEEGPRFDESKETMRFPDGTVLTMTENGWVAA